MYTRTLTIPNYSFFLFGPRGTGKTTWLREQLPKALWKNLLLDSDYLPLLAEPERLRAEVAALPEGSWVVIDEVQRLPTLLNEVHDLISRFGKTYAFALSGSSARKLKRLNANLLAGRAIDKRMFPLTSAELEGDYELERALAFGTLPDVVLNPDICVEILEAYVGTYLRQEIQQETMVADIGAFHRFLQVAAICNGSILNVSGIARDAAVSRSSVQRYFDILVDTLIGFRLPALQPRLKVRERGSAKFYLFDTGVARTLASRIRDPLHDLELGVLLETHLLHELRSAVAYHNVGGEFFYWRTAGGLEVDFVWQRGSHAFGVEVKSATKWRRENSKGLVELLKSGAISKGYGVYRGKETLAYDQIRVLPVEVFLDELHQGKLFL